MKLCLLFLWKCVCSWLFKAFEYLLDTKSLLCSSNVVLAIEVQGFSFEFVYNGYVSLTPKSVFISQCLWCNSPVLRALDYYFELLQSDCLHSLSSRKTFLATQSRGQTEFKTQFCSFGMDIGHDHCVGIIYISRWLLLLICTFKTETLLNWHKQYISRNIHCVWMLAKSCPVGLHTYAM